jgi:glucokinase
VAVAIGVDVGGTKVLAVGVDLASPGRVVASSRVATPGGGTEDLAAAVVAGAVSVADRVVASGATVVAAGVGLPGLVDVDGCLRAAPNLSRGVGATLRAPLGDALRVPVVVDNDANCATWAEVVAGAGRGAREVVLVTLGTGIGGGLVSGGRLLHGGHGFAGEPGHMVVDPSGAPCPCGRRGCWERYASGSGLERLAREAAGRGEAPSLVSPEDPRGPSGERLAELARAGDGAATAVFATFAGWLGLGLANLVNLLDPELVLVGGGLVDAAELYLGRAREVALSSVMGAGSRPPTRIEAATLGPEAGAIGAALLAAGEGARSRG